MVLLLDGSDLKPIWKDLPAVFSPDISRKNGDNSPADSRQNLTPQSEIRPVY